MASIKSICSSVIHSNSFFFTLLRSGVASQTSGWIDFGVSVAVFSWLGVNPFYSAALGAIAGGITNCLINYRFTFQDKDSPWKAVVIKYLLVWVGSLLLNSFGTEGFYWVLRKWHWLEDLGFKPSGYFTAARLFVALVVSCVWNFVLQRYFVYRSTSFDTFAIKCTNFLFHGRFRVLAKDITEGAIAKEAAIDESETTEG